MMSGSYRQHRRLQKKKEDAKFAKEWARRTIEINKGNSPHNTRILLEHFPDRLRDYGTVQFWGPFTEQELDENGIAHDTATSPTQEHWTMSFPSDRTVTKEAILRDCVRFIKDRKRELRTRIDHRGNSF